MSRAPRKSPPRKSSNKGKSRSAKKEVTKVEHELPGGFWRQTFAVILILLAVVFVATWFGEGGGALNQVHEMGLNILGWGVFLLPVVLVFLAVKIFRAPNNKLPLVVWIASFLMVIWGSGAAGVFKYGKETVTNGGVVGDFLNQYMTQLLQPGIAIIVYLVIMFLTAIFILQMSPKSAIKQMKGAVSTKKKAEKQLPEAKEKDPKNELKLKINTGRDAKTPEKKPEKPKSSSLLPFKKMKIKQPSKMPLEASTPKKASETVSALVSVSDPKWIMPTVDLFEKKNIPSDAGNIQQNALIIKSTLADFGIDVEMEGVNVGPRVAQYTMKPPQGINLSKISARDKELAMNLAAGEGVRIEAPIPGTRSVGVEVPNMKSEVVTFRNIIETKEWKSAKSPLSFVVGKDISGKAVVADLADMPHLLIAGTTGSGKSVMTNTLISSLIFRNAPSDLKLIIVDPKQVEMAQYEDIPHLLTPIITSTEKAFSALKWAEKEMDRRYSVMAEERVKKITDYNAKIMSKVDVKKSSEEDKKPEGKMPYIVIIIDEMSDLMMRASKDLEPVIVRIAQLGRAAGIHLVLATQKPVVKVITGLIKSNIPAKIAFRVNSSIDSRIILDASGAEKLLGKGDMLMTTEKMNKPIRIQGAWTYENERGEGDVKNLTGFLREQRPPQYNEEIIAQPVQIKGMEGSAGGPPGLSRKYNPNDPMVRQAVELCLKEGKFATSMLQTYMNKAHGWVSGLGIWLESIGVVGPIVSRNQPRELLITSMEEFDKLANLGGSE